MSIEKASAEIIDEILIAVDGASNFMRGMALDPQIPMAVKSALNHKVSELEAITEKYEEL